eukprot:gene30771-38549_t
MPRGVAGRGIIGYEGALATRAGVLGSSYLLATQSGVHNSSEIAVKINVMPENDAPLAQDQVVTLTAERLQIELQAADIDPTLHPRPTIVNSVARYHEETKTAGFSTQYSKCGYCFTTQAGSEASAGCANVSQCNDNSYGIEQFF